MARNLEVVMHVECRLGDVFGTHPDLVVARAEVQFGEEAGAAELVDQGIGYTSFIVTMFRAR
jgi:hypothetical protein